MTQLAAGTEGFDTFGVSSKRQSPGRHENLLKLVHCFSVRGPIVDAVARIERDEVHACRQAAEVVGELSGVVGLVVEAGDENVLDEDVAACPDRVVGDGDSELVHRVCLIDGHDLRSDVVVGGIERDSEAHSLPTKQAESAYAVATAGGRDGDAPAGDLVLAVFVKPFDGGDDVVEIVHGFAHSHEDDITDRHVELSTGGISLAHDFVDGEIPDQSHPACLTEGAGPCAAHLGADAECAPGIVGLAHGDDDGLELVAVVGALSELDGLTVGARLDDGQGAGAVVGGERLLGQEGHEAPHLVNRQAVVCA